LISARLIGKVVPVDPNAAGIGDLKVTATEGELCAPGSRIAVKNAIRRERSLLFAFSHGLPADTHLYGESFQMLSPTAGTLGKPLDLGYSERNHYKLLSLRTRLSFPGMMTLTPPQAARRNCSHTRPARLQRTILSARQVDYVVIDTEGLGLLRCNGRPGGVSPRHRRQPRDC